jgi:C4-dicarboxylate-specific signal transduction histidine kinase
MEHRSRLDALLVRAIGRAQLWQLVAASVVASTVLSAGMSLLFYGRVTYQFVTTGAVVSWAVSYLVLRIAYAYQSQIERAVEERRAAEQSLTRANEELRAANRNLERTHAQLIQSAKLASLGEMAAGVAHEINQPLTNVRLIAELLQQSLTPGSRIDVSDEADELIRSVDRITAIIDQLRASAREAGTTREPLSINDIVEESFLLVRDRLRMAAVDVRMELRDGLPPIHGNRIQLGQVFMNLLLNSSHALERASDRWLAVRSDRNDGGVALEVEDSGGGIPAELRHQVFDPFFTTKDPGAGTGLGLSISDGIVRDHGGSIDLADSADGTTRFVIHLPAASGDGEPTTVEDP